MQTDGLHADLHWRCVISFIHSMFPYQENANELKAPHLHSRIDAFSFRLYKSWWPVSGPGLESLLCGPGSLRQ